MLCLSRASAFAQTGLATSGQRCLLPRGAKVAQQQGSGTTCNPTHAIRQAVPRRAPPLRTNRKTASRDARRSRPRRCGGHTPHGVRSLLPNRLQSRSGWKPVAAVRATFCTERMALSTNFRQRHPRCRERPPRPQSLRRQRQRLRAHAERHCLRPPAGRHPRCRVRST